MSIYALAVRELDERRYDQVIWDGMFDLPSPDYVRKKFTGYTDTEIMTILWERLARAHQRINELKAQYE